MKKIVLFVSILYVLISCGSAKTSQKAINSGDYDKAISIALQKLRKNKIKKSNQQYVLMLEEAYEKAVDRDESRILFLIKDENKANLEEIYTTYQTLKQRQENIKPLLPLPIYESGKNAHFAFKNYDDVLIDSKNKLATYLYQKSLPFINSTNKETLRAVYDDLAYINQIYPAYKDVQELMNYTHEKGTDYVYVSMKNETDKIVPVRLEENLLNFDTYGLNDFWTVYHNAKIPQINYDFGLELVLTDISVSPERVKEKQIFAEKMIQDGYKNLLDTNGNVVKDSLGKKIRVKNMVKVKCELYEITQFKSSKVEGQVTYVDFNTKQVLQKFPIRSEFVFEHNYARYDGDKRALEPTYLGLIGVYEVPFPTDEQMVYDTGTDLKNQLKAILQQISFRGVKEQYSN